jgi:hypothetical protein
MGVSFSTHSVHRTLIKFYQCSLIKQPTRGSTWNYVVLKFTATYVPAEQRQTRVTSFCKNVYVYSLN